jgi:NADH-quinone oxidoreductase subunit J
MLTNFLLDYFLNYFSLYSRINLYLKIHLFYFSLFSVVIILFSLLLIFVSNPIYSVISLIIIYLFAAFVLICIEIHFLAVVFILVYLGAVVVLFLFIVMMLNIKVQNTLKIFDILISLLFLICMFFFFFKKIFFFKEYDFSFYIDIDKFLTFNDSFFDFYSFSKIDKDFLDVSYLYNLKFKKQNYIIFGFLLYSYFYVEIIIASYILLLAMIGCITLTLVKKTENARKQEPMEQLLHKNKFLKRKNI